MNVPRHAGRVWGKYTRDPQPLGAFGVAAGVTAQGAQQVVATTLRIPGSWVADPMRYVPPGARQAAGGHFADQASLHRLYPFGQATSRPDRAHVVTPGGAAATR
ncbi:MAG TPA: hypothetical protein VMO26_07215 [Vicinamibacterales bacterium]|nr:hypothetical protein [Vicinamibacterales bacterium]